MKPDSKHPQVVPHALLEFSRSVLQGTFASVVQKQAMGFRFQA